MEKGKLIPIIIAILLFILAIIIFAKNQMSNESFKKLVATYNGEKQEYSNLKVEDVIVVNNTSFWIVSIDKAVVILNSSENLENNSKKSNEFKIQLNKDNMVCFADNSCVTFKLV